MTDETMTTAELAGRLKCSPRTVRNAAKALHIGMNIGGSAGWRYTEADYQAICDYLRPVQPVAPRRRRSVS